MTAYNNPKGPASLALISHNVRMACAENNIDSVGALFDNTRHGIEHDLYAFVWRQETERQKNCLSSETVFRFGMVCLEKRKIWYSMRMTSIL